MAKAAIPITVGAILSGTVGHIRDNVQAVAIFLLVFVTGDSIGEYLGGLGSDSFKIAGGVVAVVSGLGSVIGGYLLIEAMLKRAGLYGVPSGRRFIGYFGQGILIGLGVLFGLALLIVPGLIIVARWSLAQPLFIGTGASAVESLEQSWRLTRGHTFKILMASIPLGLLLIAFVGLAALATGSDGQGDIATIVIQSFAGQAFTVFASGMAVALFGLIARPTDVLSEVFA